MATARESANYTLYHTDKYLVRADLEGGRIVPLPFEVTIVSAAADGDTYKLTVIPANARVVGLEFTTESSGASAGVTAEIGDSGSAARYMAATTVYTVNTHGTLAIAGAGYTPTADTVVLLTFAGAPTVATVMKGCLFVVPGA